MSRIEPVLAVGKFIFGGILVAIVFVAAAVVLVAEPSWPRAAAVAICAFAVSRAHGALNT